MVTQQMSELKARNNVMIKGRPCEIIQLRPGRSQMTEVIGLDLITEDQYETEEKNSATLEIPNVECQTYELVDIDEDNDSVSVLDSNGEYVDLKMPSKEMCERIKLRQERQESSS